MLRAHDLLLLAVVYATIALGILFPRFFSVLQPFPLYCLIALFFLSYLPIEIGPFVREIRKSGLLTAFLVLLKIVLLPFIIWLFFHLVYPSYAPAALLLTAISTGVTAPFIAGLVGANAALVLIVVVVTSLLVPFTVPLVIKLLLARSASISMGEMIRMLALVVFVPMALVEMIRKARPALVAGIMRVRFPLSLALFGLINLGIFSQYAEFFYREPSLILIASLVAVFLSLVYFIFGIASLRGCPVQDRLAGAVIFANINNVMVLVFAARFFGVLETTVAAMYNIPYFGIILLMRLYDHLHAKRA